MPEQPTQGVSGSTYQAPYRPSSDCILGEYIVGFYPKYTIEQHFAFLGREFEIMDMLTNGYGAKMDDDLFNRVRSDRGVKYVEDNCRGEYL